MFKVDDVVVLNDLGAAASSREAGTLMRVIEVMGDGAPYPGYLRVGQFSGLLAPDEVDPWEPKVGDRVVVKPGAYDVPGPRGSEVSEMHAGRVGVVTDLSHRGVGVEYDPRHWVPQNSDGRVRHNLSALAPEGLFPEREVDKFATGASQYDKTFQTEVKNYNYYTNYSGQHPTTFRGFVGTTGKPDPIDEKINEAETLRQTLLGIAGLVDHFMGEPQATLVRAKLFEATQLLASIGGKK